MRAITWFCSHRLRWNDGCDINQTAAYETNMVNLIKDIRAEFSVPRLPVVIAASGFGGFTNETRTPASAIPWIDMPPAAKIHTNCNNDRGCRRLDVGSVPTFNCCFLN